MAEPCFGRKGYSDGKGWNDLIECAVSCESGASDWSWGQLPPPEKGSEKGEQADCYYSSLEPVSILQWARLKVNLSEVSKAPEQVDSRFLRRNAK